MGSLFTEVWKLYAAHVQMGEQFLMVSHYLANKGQRTRPSWNIFLCHFIFMTHPVGTIYSQGKLWSWLFSVFYVCMTASFLFKFLMPGQMEAFFFLGQGWKRDQMIPLMINPTACDPSERKMVMSLHNPWALHRLSRVYSTGCSDPGINCTGNAEPLWESLSTPPGHSTIIILSDVQCVLFPPKNLWSLRGLTQLCLPSA